MEQAASCLSNVVDLDVRRLGSPKVVEIFVETWWLHFYGHIPELISLFDHVERETANLMVSSCRFQSSIFVIPQPQFGETEPQHTQHNILLDVTDSQEDDDNDVLIAKYDGEDVQDPQHSLTPWLTALTLESLLDIYRPRDWTKALQQNPSLWVPLCEHWARLLYECHSRLPVSSS